MFPVERSVMAVWAIAGTLLAPMCCAVQAEDGGDFFSVTASLEGRDVFLVREEIHINVTVTNTSDKPLAYLKARDALSTLSLKIWRRGDYSVEYIVPLRGAQITSQVLARNRVFLLHPGGSLRETFHVISDYRELPPGKYKAAVRLWQPLPDFGLARGEVLSNEVRFEVKAWSMRRLITKEPEDGFLVPGLIETDGGVILAGWKYRRQRDWTHLVALTRNASIYDLRWGTKGLKCYVEVPRGNGRTELLVVDRNQATLDSIQLRAERDETAMDDGKKADADRGQTGPAGPAVAPIAGCAGAAFIGGGIVGMLSCWLLLRRRPKRM